MPDVVWVAIIVLIGTVISALVSPYFITRLQESDRARERAEDWARQDAVAAKVDAASEQAREAAALLVISNKKVADTAASTIDKLDVIHTLVNSSLTSSMQGERDGIARELALLRTIGGAKPSSEIIAAIDVAEARAAELSAVLHERQRAAGVVSDQEKEAAKKASK